MFLSFTSFHPIKHNMENYQSKTSLSSYDSGISFQSNYSEQLNSRSAALQQKMSFAAFDLHENFEDDFQTKVGYWNFEQSPIKIKNPIVNNKVQDLVEKWSKKSHSTDTSPERLLTTRQPQKLTRNPAFKKSTLPMLRIKPTNIQYEIRKKECSTIKSIKQRANIFES